MKRILIVLFLSATVAGTYLLFTPKSTEAQGKPVIETSVKKQQPTKEVAYTEITGNVQVELKPGEVASPPTDATIHTPTKTEPAVQTVTK